MRQVLSQLRRLYWRAVFVIDGMVAARASVPPGEDIVFVRRDNLGDFILWITSVCALREQWPWPGRRFVLVANSAWSEFAKSLGIFDEVISIDTERFCENLRYRFATIARLARMPADLVVSPAHSPRAEISDSLARAISARRRIAPRGCTINSYPFSYNFGEKWYDELVAVPQARLHETEVNRAFMESAFGVNVPRGWVRLTADETVALPDAMPRSDYVLVAPGATNPFKVWELEKFAALTDTIAEQTKCAVVLVGTPSEHKQIARVETISRSKPLNMCGQMNLRQLMHAISAARLVVANETGIVHLAAALRTPVISVIGGSHFTNFATYPDEARESAVPLTAVHRGLPCFDCNSACIYDVPNGSPPPCLSGINVNDVWREVAAMLNQQGSA